MKYIIDSKGDAVSIPTDASPIRVIPQEVREKELGGFAEGFSAFLHRSGVDVQDKQFCYLVQPSYTSEQLVFFTRTEFASNSQAVKTANEVEKHPEILADREYTEFFRSIFPDNSRGKPRWYLMCAGSIAFERNLYDCKYIRADYVQPVPYARFMKILETRLSEQNGSEHTRFHLQANGISLTDTQSLLAKAFDRDIVNGRESRFDLLCLRALAECKQTRELAGRDKDSNKATVCLSIINDSKRNIFPIYQEVKNCIKKTFKGAYNIRYKGNRITAQIDDRLLTIYVCGTDGKAQFVIGGNTYNGTDSLKDALLSPALFLETDWFSEKVKPYIQEQDAPRPKRKRDKDELGWNKKQKRTRERKRYVNRK